MNFVLFFVGFAALVRDVTNGLSVDSVASRIAVFVNSLELDCNHCSNGSCGGRDPLKGFTSDGHRPE
jgi:hypothetical protein